MNTGKRRLAGETVNKIIRGEPLVCRHILQIVSLFWQIMQGLREIFSNNTLAQKTIFGDGGVRILGRLLLIHLLFAFGTSVGFGQTQIFNTSGTFTVPAGVTSITVECWGGGGGGGGQNDGRDGGGGGGGGAYSKKLAISVVPGNSYTVVVGTGGSGIAGSKGGDGGDSYFIDTNTVLAKGGIGGLPSPGIPPAGGLGGASGSGNGDVRFSGGQGESGFDGNNGRGGYGGSSAGIAANGFSGPQTFSTSTYPIASTPAGAGNGGNGGASGADGSAGSTPGGGGGGSGDESGDGIARKGGNGAAGQVIINWICPIYSITGVSYPVTICKGDAPTITVTSSAAGLPIGGYVVDYTLTGSNTGSGSPTMTVNTAGTGTFTIAALPNAGSTTITITNLASGPPGQTCNNAIHTLVTIVVNALPVIVTQPNNQLECEGHIVSFNLVATGSGLSYTWQRKKPSGSFADIPIEPNVSYPTPGTIRLENVGNSDAPDGTQYRVVITNTNNCSVVSNPATLTVNEIKGIAPATTQKTICQGDNYSYLVTTSYPLNVVSYQWKKWINPEQWDTVSNGGAISGATTEHLVFTGATPSESGEYKVTIVFHSSGAYCNVTSDSRQRVLTVNPIPSCSISGPNSVYAGSVNNSYTSTPTPSDNVNHSWSISGNGTIVGSTTGATITITAVAVGSYTLRDDISRYECTSYCTYEVIVTNLPCSITPDTSVPNSSTTTYSAPSGMDYYLWSIAGNGSITSGIISQTADILAGNSCSTYTVKLAMAKNGASSNCEHTITVTDTIRPAFTLPLLATGYCVEDISQAVYNEVPEGNPLDLTYPRPDYYIFGVGFTMLNLPSYSDNCALKAPEPISWSIDFGNNGSIEYSGNGQLSAYGTAIHFPVGTNRITCTVTDAVGNTRVKFVDLVVIPRPVMTKIF